MRPTTVEQAKRDVDSAQRSMQEEIEAAQENYANAVSTLCDLIHPTDEEAVQVGYENAEHLNEGKNFEDGTEELVKSLDEILSLREKSKAAGA